MSKSSMPSQEWPSDLHLPRLPTKAGHQDIFLIDRKVHVERGAKYREMGENPLKLE